MMIVHVIKEARSISSNQTLNKTMVNIKCRQSTCCNHHLFFYSLESTSGASTKSSPCSTRRQFTTEVFGARSRILSFVCWGPVFFHGSKSVTGCKPSAVRFVPPPPPSPSQVVKSMASRDLSRKFVQLRSDTKARSVRRRNISSTSPSEGNSLIRDADVREWEAARHALPPIWVDSVDEVNEDITKIKDKSELHT